MNDTQPERVSHDRRNWGRWGADDERGALNLASAERVARALALPSRGEVHELGRPISRRTPAPGSRQRPVHYMGRDGGDYGGDRSSSRAEFADDALTVSLHTGTHVDALAHVWRDGELYNGFSKDTVASSGAHRCGIDKLGPIVARGVLADLVGHAGGALRDGAPVTADELRDCLSAQGTQLEEGDVLLLRTGWWEASAGAPGQDFSREPGPDLEAGRWLAEQDLCAVGADNFAFELMPSGHERVFPVHELLLRDCGVPIFEGLDLDAIAAASAYEFLFVAIPLPLVGGTASPVDPIAIV
jgi:kynurenine formamidase